MNLAKYIEHTLLKPEATKDDIKKLAQEAIEQGFWGICINPNYVAHAKSLLEGTPVKLVTVVNFPLGTNCIDATLVQVHEALADGADEIDTVINIAALKDGDYKTVTDDIKKTKAVCGAHILKVILETDLLSKDEIKKACLTCITAGADFVKTSTGFVKDGFGARPEIVRLMAETVSKRGLGVKASGGVRSKFQAIELVNAGATRLGTSSGIQIVNF